MNNIRFEHVAHWLLLPLLIGAFAIPTAGCARRTRRGVQVAVAGQMRCPARALRSYPIGDQRFRVEGCGNVGVFQCYRRGRRSLACTPVQGPRPMGGGNAGGQVVVQAAPPAYAQPAQPAQPVQTAQAWSPQLGQQVFNQSAPHVLACVPAPTPISLNLEYGVDGTIARVGGLEQFPPPQQTCLTNALQYAAVPGGLAQAVVVPFRYR